MRATLTLSVSAIRIRQVYNCLPTNWTANYEKFLLKGIARETHALSKQKDTKHDITQIKRYQKQNKGDEPFNYIINHNLYYLIKISRYTQNITA